MNILDKNRTINGCLTLAILICTSQQALTHTVLETPQVSEMQKITNNIIIGHGCNGSPVIGTSIVFPDGENSKITMNGSPYDGTLNDFLQNWGNLIQLLQNRSVFSEQDEKLDATGNVNGFWSGGGRSMAANLNAHIPFTIGAAFFEPGSCAKSVQFSVAIVDICKITHINNFTDDAVSLWTPAVGSKYDGVQGEHGYNSPAIFRINRDLTANPLPDTCGDGVEVTVSPSAEQIDRDMPIFFNGSQVWPLP